MCVISTKSRVCVRACVRSCVYDCMSVFVSVCVRARAACILRKRGRVCTRVFACMRVRCIRVLACMSARVPRSP